MSARPGAGRPSATADGRSSWPLVMNPAVRYASSSRAWFRPFLAHAGMMSVPRILEIRQNAHCFRNSPHVFFFKLALRHAHHDAPVGDVIAGQLEVIQKRFDRSRLGVRQVVNIDAIRIEVHRLLDPVRRI